MLKGLLSWSNLTDSAGRRISTYALKFDEGFLDWRGQILSMAAEGIWTFFMLVSTLTTTLLGWVSDPKWLDSLSEGYHNLTKTAFGVINPLYVAVGAFVILMVYVMVDTAKSTSMKLTKSEVNRITAGIVIMLIVAVMVANPFALLNEALSLAGSLVEVITGDTQTKVLSTTVDAMIRQPTLIINYGGAVSEACATQWSRTGSLSSGSGCFSSGGDVPTFSSILLAMLALFVAFTSMVFTIVSIWKFTLHLTVAVVGVISLPWVAAMTIAKRRQFDGMGTVMATVGGHLLMAVITQLLTVLGPTLMAKFLSGWGQTDWAIVQMFLLALSWIALTALMLFVTKKNGALVRALKADASKTLNRYLGVPGGGYFAGGPSYASSFKDARAQISSSASSIKSSAVKLVKGKAAEMLNRGGGKGIMEDLKPVQDVLKHTSPGIPTRIQVPALPSAPRIPELTAGRGGMVIDSDGNKLPEFKMLALPAAPGSTPLGSGDRYGDGSGGMGALVPFGDEILDVSYGAPSVDDLRRAYVLQQDFSDDPMYGGLTHRDFSDAVINVEVENVLDEISVIPPATVVQVAVASSGVIEPARLSVTESLARSERERASRARSDIAVLHGQSDRDDMVYVQSAVGVQRSTPSQELVARYPRMSAVVRSAKRGINGLRGGVATRGDVRATRVTSLTGHADSESLRTAALMKARALGGNVLVNISNDDPAYDMIVTSDNPNGTVMLRIGIGFGDRIH